MIVKCKKCGQKHRVEIENINKFNKCGKCKERLKMGTAIYKDTNIEITQKWSDDLKKKFIFEMPENIHILEKTKIVKKNILDTLEVAHNIVSLSQEKDIFETSQSKENIEVEIEKIRKDVVSIAVFGQMKSGKSSFLNSLVGEELLIVKNSRATATITMIRHIDNFDNKKDGDIEIHYKKENEILLNIEKALFELDDYFSSDESFNSFSAESMDIFRQRKEELIQKLDNSDFKGLNKDYKKSANGLKKLLKLILNGLDENTDNIGKIITSNTLENDILISDSKSVFISNVVFYKDLELLKNIELIDTPGLGSNSQLDTRKSEEFIEKADIVMILTEAVKPMQQDGETDILYILEDIQKKENDKNFFDKVFIIINKIDDNEELNRDEIKELLEESLEDADVEVKDKNIMFISAAYEYQKKFSPDGLKDLVLKNRDNIGENDLKVIEQTIYDFSAAESTSKFLDENIKQIEKMFNDANENFENNIEKLSQNISITEENIKKFQSKKDNMVSELKKELHTITRDGYREIESKLNHNKNYILKEKEYTFTIERETGSVFKGKTFSEKINGVLGYDYAYYKARSEKTLSKALYDNDDRSEARYYTTLGRAFLNKIITKANSDIEQKINQNLSSKIPELKGKLAVKAKQIQEKYVNEYAVTLSSTDISINPIKIKISDNIDLTRGNFRQFYQIFSLFAWGTEMKYTETIAREWERYANDEYIGGIDNEIKSEIDSSKTKVNEEVNEEIKKILKAIESQLNQELKDKEKFNEDKEKTNKDKEIIQNAFKLLHSDFISHAKEQNINLFK